MILSLLVVLLLACALLLTMGTIWYFVGTWIDRHPFTFTAAERAALDARAEKFKHQYDPPTKPSRKQPKPQPETRHAVTGKLDGSGAGTAATHKR